MGLFSGITKTIKNVVGGVSDLLDGGIGSLVTGGLSYLGSSSANAANRQLAQQQMAYQTDMSNTSYQRVVEDMKAAGLNPMLAYSQGGASTPSGSMATMQDEITGATSTAQQSRRLQAEIDNMRESNDNIRANTSKTQADTDLTNQNIRNSVSQEKLNEALRAKAVADAALSVSSARNQATQNRLLEATVPEAEVKKAAYGAIAPGVKKLSNSVQDSGFFDDLINSAKSLYNYKRKSGYGD